MQGQNLDASEPSDAGGVPLRHWYVLAVLMTVNVLNWVDRNLPFILVEAIRRDLNLSDTQLGLLGGVAFSLIYSIASLPMGHLADRVSRRSLLGWVVLAWGVMSAAGGTAMNFLQLAMSRIGLALGEAVTHPAATSILADLFPERRRKLVLAMYLIASNVGIMLSLVFGGWLAEATSWRNVLFIFAIPSVAVSVLLFLTVPEPPRRRSTAPGPSPGLFAAAAKLLGVTTFRQISFALCAYTVTAISFYSFLPAFAMRSYGWSSGEAGLRIGLIFGVAAASGSLIGASLSERWSRRDIRWSLWLAGGGMLLGALLLLAVVNLPNPAMAIAILPLPVFLIEMYKGPIFAIAQDVAGTRMRSFAIAVVGFSMFAVGGTVGPVFTGWMSDQLKPAFGKESLRYVLCIVAVALIPSAYHFFRAARTLVRDLRAANPAPRAG